MINDRDILLFLEGRADAETSATVSKWLAEDATNAAELEDLKELNNLSNELTSYNDFNTDEAWSDILGQLDFEEEAEKPASKIVELNGSVNESAENVVPMRRKSYAPAMAASFLVLLLAGLIAFNQRPRLVELATNVEEEHHVILPDGSVVDIEPNTTLRYSTNMHKQSTRNVYVFGKARFDVVSDPEKPFIVNTIATGTRVLGTIFEVESVSEEAVLANEEGLVSFFSLADTSISTLVKEGETFKFDGTAFEEVVEELPPPPPPGKIMNVLDMVDSLHYYYPQTFEIKPYIPENQFLDSVRVDLSKDLNWAIEVLDSFNNVNIDFNGKRCVFYGLRSDD